MSVTKHGHAADLSPAFIDILESRCEEIRDSLPRKKTFALFVIHHDTPMPHEVTMIGPHTPTETAELLAPWWADRARAQAVTRDPDAPAH